MVSIPLHVYSSNTDYETHKLYLCNLENLIVQNSKGLRQNVAKIWGLERKASLQMLKLKFNILIWD